MPDIAPVTLASRGGVKETAHTYEETWVSIPFETYEGMTQAMFQKNTGAYGSNGAKVTVNVPKGWRRVETPYAGKHIYVNMETGVISRIPKDQYNCRKDCWVKPDGSEIPDAEVMADPYALVMKLGQNDAPGTMKAVEDQVVKKVVATSAPAPAPAAAGQPLPVCLMFPGQGSQYVKMMSSVKDLPAVAEMCAKAEKILGYDLLELCLKGPESKLEKTQYCQPAMFVAGLAGVEKLKADSPENVNNCRAVAGLSLGEYTAMCVAGVLDFETGLKLVKLRGEAMEEAASACAQSMVSVAGLDEATLSKLCEEAKSGPDDVCQIANFLFPNGFSCAGHQKCVEKLLEIAQKTPGCLQSKLLKTSGGFHTDLMKPAQEKLIAALKEAEPSMKPPRCDIYMNTIGKKITPATPISEITDLMGKQLTSTVLWEPSVKEMIKDGITTFYECGPMKQLKAMMKRIDIDSFSRTTTVDV